MFPKEISKWGPKALAFRGWSLNKGTIVPSYALPVIGVSTLRRNAQLPRNRRFAILRRKGLLASPYSDCITFATKSDKFRYRFELEERLPEGKLSRLYKFAFEAYRAFTASLSSVWDGYDVPMTVIQEAIKQRTDFLCNPELRAKQLKSCLQALRDYVLGGIEPTNELMWFYPLGVKKRNLLQASAAIRAIPAPLGFMIKNKGLIKDLKFRLGQPPPPIDEEFKTWVKNWVIFNQPYYPIGSFAITPTTAACLEFSRKDGGLRTAIELLSQKHPLSGHESTWFDEESKKVRNHCKLENENVENYLPSLQLMAACVSTLRPFFKHVRKCPGGCRKSSKHPPMVALIVPERGLKVRMPTMSTGPIAILARVLRSAADGFLRSDSRISPSLEGKAKLPRQRRENWRSQDLTTATDNHTVEYTREFYYQIGKLIPFCPPWWDDVVRVVCGFYTIISQNELDELRSEFKRDSFEPPFKEALQAFRDEYIAGKAEMGRTIKPLISDTRMDTLGYSHVSSNILKRIYFPMDGTESYHEYLARRTSGMVTRRGQPMGVATSWPMLPLYTLYSFEMALAGPLKVIKRKIRKRPTANPYDLTAFTQMVQSKGPLVELSRDIPPGAFCIQTTGDDAIFSCTTKESLRHTELLTQLGSDVSKTKDYLNLRYAIYTEVFYKDGRPLGIFPWAPILAPTGVRQNTWYSQAPSLKGMEIRHKRQLPIMRSPFYGIWKHLNEIGAPVGLDPIAGGLGLTRFPGSAERRQIAAYRLLQLTESELLSFPPGFFIPDPNKDGLLFGKNPSPTPTGVVVSKNLARVRINPFRTQLATRSIQSPYIEISISKWIQLFYMFDTWNQVLYPPDPVREPSLVEFIQRTKRQRHAVLSETQICDIIEEAKADCNDTIKFPWGLLSEYHPVFGLIRPSTPVPLVVVNSTEKGLSEVLELKTRETDEPSE